MPLSMIAASAPLTNPQLSVAELPAVMVVGEMLKDAMLGVPTHAVVGAAVGVASGTMVGTMTGGGAMGGAGAGTVTTVIFTQTVGPK